ncbi:flagellar basal body-associated protein FliL [Paracoccus litorisediminis]|uniref:flagellar basal body-associated FliL family protein n=1 Tax=Paracoccus litorisediminis TaxID=2006130 RepID=UPI003731AA74
MTEASAPEQKSGKSHKFAVVIGLCCIVGLGIGFGAPVVLAASSAPKNEAHVEDHAKIPENIPALAELPVGRITVALDKAGLPGRYLVLDTIVEYDNNLLAGHAPESGGGHGKAESGGALDAKHARIRDAFIEYLSHVSEGEISGSAGMANLRSELLRRARAVTASEAPTAVLIQDFIIQ